MIPIYGTGIKCFLTILMRFSQIEQWLLTQIVPFEKACFELFKRKISAMPLYHKASNDLIKSNVYLNCKLWHDSKTIISYKTGQIQNVM